ncbi:Lipase [Porphyridium purpureum]|uniref:Lipase n=1 Tax=Porphyridium purpureum TaxID=35688 RepID=A0A5J4YH40_PORPP|nr:Lipase [Porphyridium purpureum]|eukprot:POR4752..scf270_19
MEGSDGARTAVRGAMDADEEAGVDGVEGADRLSEMHDPETDHEHLIGRVDSLVGRGAQKVEQLHAELWGEDNRTTELNTFVTDVFEMHSRGATHKLLMQTFSGRQMSWIWLAWALGILLSLVFSILVAFTGENGGTLTVVSGPNGETQSYSEILTSVIQNLSFQVIMGWLIAACFAFLWFDMLLNWLKAPRRIRVPQQLLVLCLLPLFVLSSIPYRAIRYRQLFDESPSGDVSIGSLAAALQIDQSSIDDALRVVGQVFYSLIYGAFAFYIIAKPILLRRVSRTRKRKYVLLGAMCTLYSTAICLFTLCMSIGTNAPPFCAWLRVIRCFQVGIGTGPGSLSGFQFGVCVFLALCDFAFLLASLGEVRRSEIVLRSVVYHLFRADVLALSFFKIGLHLLVVWSWVCTSIQFAPIPSEDVIVMLRISGRLFTDELRFPSATFAFLAFMFIEVILSYPASATRIFLVVPLRRLVTHGRALEWKARMSRDDETGNVIVDPSEFVLELQILLMNFAAFAYDFGVAGKTPRDVSVLSNGTYKLVAHISNAVTDTHCIVCEADDSIVVSFRGTLSAQNVKTDIRAGPLHVRHILDLDSKSLQFDNGACASDSSSPRSRQNVSEGLDKKLLHRLDLLQFMSEDLDRRVVKVYDHATEKYCRVHAGFGEAYVSVHQDVIVLVQLLLLAKERPVFVAGHSLGGALATLCAYHLSKVSQESVRDKIVLVTCGSPRVGNSAFAHHFHERVKNVWRIHVEGDPVPRMPKLPYLHVGAELILRIDGEIVADPTLVESVQFRRQPIKVAHHRMWVYRGIVQTFCELYTAPGFIPDMWDLGEFPEEFLKAVRPSEEKIRNAQLLKLERIIRERSEFEILFQAFKTQLPDHVSSRWKTLIAALLASG